MPRCDMGHSLCNACSQCHYCTEGEPGVPLPEGGCRNCWKVKSFCQCLVCSKCNKLTEHEQICLLCVKCIMCCECPECTNCGKRGSVCTDCSKCNGCCRCKYPSFIRRELVKNVNDVPEFGNDTKSFKINKSKRFISVEIEISSCKNFKPIRKVCEKWNASIVEDGSLNGDSPFEINTAPTKGDRFVEQIKEFEEAFKLAKTSINSSCGLHVHIEAADFNWWDLSKLIRLYAKIENGLFKIVSPERRHVRYCIPCGEYLLENLNLEGRDIKAAISNAVYRDDKRYIPEVRGQKYASVRYAALNLHSCIHRGTIESRIHHGTVQSKDIINWGMLWGAIVDYAYKHPKFSHLPTGGFESLLYVTPNSLKEWVTDRKNTYSRHSS